MRFPSFHPFSLRHFPAKRKENKKRERERERLERVELAFFFFFFSFYQSIHLPFLFSSTLIVFSVSVFPRFLIGPFVPSSTFTCWQRRDIIAKLDGRVSRERESTTGWRGKEGKQKNTRDKKKGTCVFVLTEMCADERRLLRRECVAAIAFLPRYQPFPVHRPPSPPVFLPLFFFESAPPFFLIKKYQ